MRLLFSITMPSEKIIQAFTWTFIHSLWQGMVLCIVVAGILFFTKKATAALRYNLLTAALFIFLGLMAFNFNNQLVRAKQVAPITKIIPIANVVSNSNDVSILQENNGLTITSSATSFIANNANWIMLVWFIMIALQFIRLAIGLYKVAYLKKTKVFSASEYWNNRLVVLQKQLQISTPVLLLQSGIAKIPVAIGFFKPVILFPAAMLATLPVNEIEAVLLHELAHIRRKDFLVNLLQSIIEIIFFFNPAVLWVSTLIKVERENCCDDIAINYTGSKQNYINALLSFQMYDESPTASLSAAFAGEKKYLLNRIKRIIYNNNKTLSNMEKKFLAAGIILTSACFFTFSTSNAQKKEVVEKIVNKSKQNAEKNAKANAIPNENSVKASDTNNVFKGTINRVVAGKKYLLIIDNNQLKELYVEGAKIAAEKMSNYKKITDEIMMQAKLDMEQSKVELAQSKMDMEQHAKEMEQAKKEMEQSKAALAQSKMDVEQQAKEMEQARKESEQAKMEIEQAKKEMEQAKKEMEQASKETARSKKESELARKESDLARKESEMAKQDIEIARRDAEVAKKESEQSRIIQEHIVQDFIMEHIISNVQELRSYKLNNASLIVNGVKQSDVIHEKLKSKYSNGDKWGIIYNNANDIK